VLADTMVGDYDAIDLLDRLIGFCVELLPPGAAGIAPAGSCGSSPRPARRPS
jgi:hypothetical protein